MSSSFTGAVTARVRLALCMGAGASGCAIESRGSSPSASSSSSVLRILLREGARLVVIATLGFARTRGRAFAGSDRATGAGVARLRAARVLGACGSEMRYGIAIGRRNKIYCFNNVYFRFSRRCGTSYTSPRLGTSRTHPRLSTGISRPWCSSRLFVLNNNL
ncbi:hypothetical protein EV424DRAFT_587013 [Suillus variegatus]|nr:hypothetical protein EV424DRAFT_587013 [Suillus variegatus]